MLRTLRREIADCYHRAAICREKARLAFNPVIKADFLRMEQSWLLLARSREFAQRLQAFAAENVPKKQA